MWNELHAVLLRHPGDTALLADATDFGDVGLDDVERTRFQERLERLPSRLRMAPS